MSAVSSYPSVAAPDEGCVGQRTDERTIGFTTDSMAEIRCSQWSRLEECSRQAEGVGKKWYVE